jgi:hypothetical protein
MPKVIPENLTSHILPFNWNVHQVWSLEATVQQVPFAQFAYLLQLPLWSSVPHQGMLFDTRPIDVINNPNYSIHQTQRLEQADVKYPIDVLIMQDQQFTLDGVHRIAKHFILNSSTIPARFHDESVISVIHNENIVAMQSKGNNQ